MNIRLTKGLYQSMFWIIIMSSFIAWIVCLFFDPQGHQKDIFYICMGDFWGDAANPTGMVSGKDPYRDETTGLWNANYPPLAYMLFFILANVSPVPEGGYLHYYYQPIWTLLFIIALFTVLLLLHSICVKKLSAYSGFNSVMISLSLCLSYPMLHTIERGNILIVSILMTTIFVFYFNDNCEWKKELALICLAIAIGLKLSPAVFGLLLIHKKDWRALFRTAIYSFITIFAPFFFLDGDLSNIVLWISNMKLWFVHHINYTNIYGTGFVASFMKYSNILLGTYNLSDNAYLILTILRYEITVILLLGMFRLNEEWKVVLNLTIILLIFPAASHTYNVLYIIPFTVLFLQSFVREKVSADRVIIFACLIMIYFVYRCSISDFFNFNFSIPALTIVSIFYSLKKLAERKRIFNIQL